MFLKKAIDFQALLNLKGLWMPLWKARQIRLEVWETEVAWISGSQLSPSLPAPLRIATLSCCSPQPSGNNSCESHDSKPALEGAGVGNGFVCWLLSSLERWNWLELGVKG